MEKLRALGLIRASILEDAEGIRLLLTEQPTTAELANDLAAIAGALLVQGAGHTDALQTVEAWMRLTMAESS